MNPKNSERGFVLMVVYIVAALVSVFSIAFFARHHVNMQSAERYQNRIRAFNAAEAGIDAALHELTVASRQAETAAAAYTSPETVLTQSAFHYTISPVQGQPLRRRIDARGCSPSCTSTSRGYQDADITVYCQIASAAVSSNLFSYGVYTTGNMILDKFRFDSYNSTSAYGGSNISDAGAIATNSTAIGAITMTNATVNGSAMVSENGNPVTGITQTNSTITGTTGKLPSGWTLAAPPSIAELPEPPTELGSYRGGTLPAGTYHATEIKISGQGSIVATGAVKIYVDGGVDITGQGTTVAGDKPGNLQIYVTGTESCKITANGSFYGALYAPNSDVTFHTSSSGKGGNLFGAVVAKTFSTSGGSKGYPTVHFDLALKEDTVPVETNTTVSVTAWQEMDSLAWS